MPQLPRGARPEVTVDLPALSHEQALRQILLARIPGEPRRVEEIVRSLVDGERELSSEIRPGVVVPHARVGGIDEPILLLGTSAGGIEFPGATEPARLIFVLLSPEDQPRKHLRALAEIVRAVRRDDAVDELLAAVAGAARDARGGAA